MLYRNCHGALIQPQKDCFSAQTPVRIISEEKAYVMQNKSAKLQHMAAAFRQIAKALKAEKKTFHPQ